jgi:hypothetical protein
VLLPLLPPDSQLAFCRVLTVLASPSCCVAAAAAAAAAQIDNPLLRGVAKAAAVYRAALRPRLLVLVGLAALVGAYGKVRG